MVKKEILYVNMNGIRVGQLARENSGAMSFRYDSDWKSRSESRPISLSLPLADILYTGSEVYNFFDNLLPDSDQIRSRIQRRFRSSTTHPFDLLRSIGRDCVGAVQLTSEDTLADVKKINCEPLSDFTIARILKEYKTAPLGITEDDDDFRISLAGAQEKTAFTLYQGQWCKPHGTTPTTHIFKRPIGVINHSRLDLGESCENEWLCLEIVKGFGVPVANAMLSHFEDEKVLIVERFDRRFSKKNDRIIRLPQEDMCQALGFSPHLKYESDGGPGIGRIMEVLLFSRRAEYDRKVFMKSQLVFWLLAAIDGHAKNFSIFLEPQNRFSLTPLYDVLSAYPYFASGKIPKEKAKMAMALRGKNVHYKWKEMTRNRLLSTAKDADYSPELMDVVIDEVISCTDSVIHEISNSLPSDFPDFIATPIFEGFMRAVKDL